MLRNPPLLKRRHRKSAPLSFVQRQMWVLDQMAPGNPAYNLPHGLRLRGPLQLAALEDSFNAVIRRHESLRTTFGLRHGEPRQFIHPELRLRLQVTSLEHLPAELREATLQNLASAESIRPFDLSRLPLMRVSLFVLGKTDHVLLINLHHTIADGLSLGPMLAELDALYRAAMSGSPIALPDLALQYADYALWQRQALAKQEAYSRQLEYWRRQLGDGLPVLELPTDRPRPAIQSFHGANEWFDIPSAQAEALRALGAAQGCTLFMSMLALFQALLHRHTGAEDLVIGAPVATRTTPELQPLIGAFLNLVALRCDLSGNPTFTQLLRRTQRTALDAFANGEAPLEVLMQDLRIPRDPSRNPIFQVATQYLATTAPRLGDLEVSLFEFDPKFAQFDLTLHLHKLGDRYRGRFEYCTELFDSATIRRLSGHYLTLLEAVAREPERGIATLPMLTAAEQHQVLEGWNQISAVYPPARPIHQLVEAQARIRPDALAAEAAGRRLTYGELNAWAEDLAQRLRRQQVRANTLVAIYLDRSLEWLTGLLAVWKAGGAYLPIDPEYPPERIRFLLEDSQALIVLTRQSLQGALPATDTPVVVLDQAMRSGLPSSGPQFRRSRAAAEHLAYVIYTSGSTGRPKGVAITHASLFNLLCWHQQAYAVTPTDRASQIAGPAFDASVWEVWPYLTAGASVHFPDADTRLEAARLIQWLADHKITQAFLPTPLAEAALRETWPQAVALRVLLTGGDRLTQRPGGTLPFRLINHYGPTENCVVSTCGEVEPGPALLAPPIGRPLPNTCVYILDGHFQPVPIGVPGQLFLGGIQLAAGYWNRPELTAEKFIPNPFRPESGTRLYLTGDLARWLPDGQIEFLGRLDHQVKLRGLRLELGEVEAVLTQHPAVHQAVVLAREDVAGQKRLVAYFTAQHPPADLVDELRAHLRLYLPEYMVPAAFVRLDAFPLTPNGKLDRQRLPPPERVDSNLTPYVAPRTRTEAILAGIWAAVLGQDRVGIEENFFALGGHSLLAMRVVSRVRQSLNLELPLRDCFTCATVARLAARLDALRNSSHSLPAPPPIEGAMPAGPVELSFSQQRLWFLDQMEPGWPTYVISGAMELRGPLDVPALERALAALVKRHESLRTVFVSNQGRPRQVVREAAPWTLEQVEISPRDNVRARLEGALQQEVARGFDLARGPLFRARLYRVAADRFVLLLAMHHIVSDGWSMGILFRELGASYRSFCQGEVPSLPPLRLQYRDFARWQRAWLQGQRLQDLLARWRARLAEAPQVLELPADRTRLAVESNRGARYAFTVPRQEAEALRRFARAEDGTTLFMTLLAGFALLLARWSGQSEMLIGTPVANRSRAEFEEIVGCFVNTLVLRADLSGDPTVQTFVGRLREVCVDAFAHQDMPFERLVQELRPARDLSRNPLVQVLFALQNAPVTLPQLPGLSQATFPFDPLTAPFDLTLQVEEADTGLEAHFEYSTELFDEATIVRLAAQWRTLLSALVAFPSRRLSELPILPENERRQLLVEWNPTGPKPPSRVGVHHLFEEQVDRTSSAWAISCDRSHLTYQDLDRRANQFAAALRQLGAGPGQRVGICVDRSCEMLAVTLGILKAGAAYVPLEPSLPADRLRFIEEDAQLTLLVSTTTRSGRFRLPRARQLLLDADAQTVAAAPPTRLANEGGAPSAEQPAYLIYTSSSTGPPKGVVVPHRAVINCLTGLARELGLAAHDVMLAVAPLSTDSAVLELQLPLTVGARVVLATHDPPLAELLQECRATVLQTTPPAWRLLLNAGWTPRSAFKALVSGETLPRALADRLLAAGVELWKLYGHTETTVCSTCARMDGIQSTSLGRPLANTTVRILQARRHLCPIGVPGELCIGGEGVSLGYWNLPELTASRFIPDPFALLTGATLFCTGDRARWRPDGTLEHLGRLDFPAQPAPQTLPGLERTWAPLRGATDAPRSPAEAVVINAFRQVLGRADFGVFDNFFDLGGHSLMAAQLMSRLRTASGCDLPLRQLFERPTAAGLAEAIEELSWLGRFEAPGGDNRDRREEIEL